jgi:hypothetical protein
LYLSVLLLSRLSLGLFARAGRLKHTKWGDHDLQTISPFHSLHLPFTCVCDTSNFTPGLCFAREMMRLNSQKEIISQRSARIKRVKLVLFDT